jgi:hypothetical protein
LNIAGGGVVNRLESRRDVVDSATHLDLESRLL